MPNTTNNPCESKTGKKEEEKSQPVNQKDDGYLFCWNDVPENNEEFIEFLKSNLRIEWANKAIINKSYDKKTISVSYEENLITLTLDVYEGTVLVCVGGKCRYKSIRIKGDKINVYTGIYREIDIKIERPSGVTLCAILVGILGVVQILSLTMLFLTKINLEIIPLLITILYIFWHGTVSYGLFKLYYKVGYESGVVLSVILSVSYLIEFISTQNILSLAMVFLYAPILIYLIYITGDVFEEAEWLKSKQEKTMNKGFKWPYK